METLDSCVCGHKEAAVQFSKWSLQIVECSACGLAFVNPRTYVAEADEYFRGAYLDTIETNRELKPEIARIYELILRDLSSCLKNPGKLLDMGCAMGHFMAFAQSRGWDPLGVECSQFAAQYGTDRFGLKIVAACELEAVGLPASYYDACVLIEVAEHLRYPRKTFEEVFRVLKPGGVLYLTTPNWGSYRSLLRREEWSPMIPTGHLFYFAGPSMTRLLQAVGFIDILDLTHPADFDAEVEEARASGTLRLNDQQLRLMHQRTAGEDADKLTNGRGEGLIFCARKPWSGLDPVVAEVLEPDAKFRLEGRLITGPGTTPEDQKVFYVRKGQKNWVTSVNWIIERNMSLSDAIQVSRAELRSLVEGPSLP
jgi:SAM-dependent methyltransferase